MQSLIPITSAPLNNTNETILLNPNELNEWYGFSGPYQIAKTSIPVELDEEWSVVLEDRQYRACLISSSDIDCSKMPVIDLVEALGHRLTIAPWQKLYFRSALHGGTYVTYLLDFKTGKTLV